MNVLLSILLAAAPSAKENPQPGLFWGFTLQGGGQVVTDEDVDSVGGGWSGALRFDFGEMLNETLGVGLTTGFTAGSSSLFQTRGGFIGMAARIYPVDRFSVQPSIGVALITLARRNDALETDDDPSSLFGARTAVGVAYDVARFDNGFALAIGAEASATYGSGTTIFGGGATISITRFRREATR